MRPGHPNVTSHSLHVHKEFTDKHTYDEEGMSSHTRSFLYDPHIQKFSNVRCCPSVTALTLNTYTVCMTNQGEQQNSTRDVLD